MGWCYTSEERNTHSNGVLTDPLRSAMVRCAQYRPSRALSRRPCALGHARLAALAAGWLLLWSVQPAGAHFLMLIPSSDVISAQDERAVTLDIRFSHPMEGGPVMEMARPRRFGVLVGGQTHDLTAQLAPVKIDGRTAFAARVPVNRPADYVFFIEPAPYWEPAEQKMIVHYT